MLSLVASPLVTSTQSALKKVSGSLAQCTDVINLLPGLVAVELVCCVL